MSDVYQEVWLPVVGYENEYEVSNWARIRRIQGSYKAKYGTFLRPYYNKINRGSVTLCKDGVKKTLAIHSIVATAFIGPCPEGMQVNHRDGNTFVNWALNLEYTTPLANTRHAIENGIRGYGNARLLACDVREIRRLKGSMKQIDIAKKFGVSRSTILKIDRGEVWKDVT